MRLRAAYPLFTRTTKQGAAWHVSWYDKDGLRHTQSTGEAVRPDRKDRGRTLAERAAVQIVHTVPRRVPTFKEYAGAFFAEASSYVKRQRAKGRSFGSHWAGELQSLIDNYAMQRCA